jgi:hypothetical protein
MVGCGQAWCPNGYPGNSSLNMIFTVCNYYTAGNYRGQYPYDDGAAVCTEDLQPGDACVNGLVTPADYVDGLGYECDVDGDGKLELGEVVDALKTVTGR